MTAAANSKSMNRQLISVSTLANQPMLVTIREILCYSATSLLLVRERLLIHQANFQAVAKEFPSLFSFREIADTRAIFSNELRISFVINFDDGICIMYTCMYT